MAASRGHVTFVPPLAEWPAAGVYQLWLRVSAAACPRVGRLGRCRLAPGLYVYTGRAARGLRARVRRHAGRRRRAHWHIDYLLNHPRVRLECVVLVSPDPDAECTVNQTCPVEGTPVLPGFGASDCRSGCRSHLRRLTDDRPAAIRAGVDGVARRRSDGV